MPAFKNFKSLFNCRFLTLAALLCLAATDEMLIEAQPPRVPTVELPYSRDRFRSRSLWQNEDDQNAQAPPPEEEYLPDNPNQWGAPGNPSEAANTDFSQEESFPPNSEPQGPSLQEQFDAADSTTAIKLRQSDKFLTADWVQLTGLFYKGNANKQTIPVLLIHDFGSNKESLASTAQKLSEAGYAVLVPDLRGHGESVVSWLYDYSAGGERPAIRKKDDYKVDAFTENDFNAMRLYDGQLWYQFFAFLNNAEKLNIRRLVIIGFGRGGSIGASWLANDWQTPGKKGRFAKELILVSPEEDPIFNLLAEFKARPALPDYKIYVGNLVKAKKETAEKIQLTLGGDRPETAAEERKVPLVGFKTEKQGVELFDVESFGLAQSLIDAIACRNESKQKWQLVKP